MVSSSQIEEVPNLDTLDDDLNEEPPVANKNKGKEKAVEEQFKEMEIEDEFSTPETGHVELPAPIPGHSEVRAGNHLNYPSTTTSKRLTARKRPFRVKTRAPDLPLPHQPTVDAHEDSGGLSSSIQFMAALEPGKVRREGVKIELFSIEESHPPFIYEFLASEATVSDYYSPFQCCGN
jgi:hypothetical protein